MSELPINNLVLEYRMAKTADDGESRSPEDLLRSIEAKVRNHIQQPQQLEGLQGWQDGGICKAFPDLMFPEKGEKKIKALAKVVCRTCVVRERCWEEGLGNGNPSDAKPFGVWGGLDERERRRVVNDMKMKMKMASTVQESDSDPDSEAA